MPHDLQTLQRMYDSEINVGISSPCWDGGWRAWIGDELSEPIAQADHFDGIDKAMDWLVAKVLETYPDSDFAKDHRAIALRRAALKDERT